MMSTIRIPTFDPHLGDLEVKHWDSIDLNLGDSEVEHWDSSDQRIHYYALINQLY